MIKLRVLQLVSGVAIGDQSGGAEYFALRMARLLDPQKFETGIFSMWRFSSASEQEWLARLQSEHIDVGGLVTPGDSLRKDMRQIISHLWHMTHNFKPHIINSHSERGDLLNALVHLFHPLHPKAVRTIHIDKQWITQPVMGAILESSLFPFCFQEEIAISQTVLDQLNQRRTNQILGKRARLIYNGIDESFFSASSQSEILPDGIPNDRPRIGIIGRLTDQKGHADLLEAMQIVIRQQPAVLLVIGSGPLENDLRRKAANLGVAESVYFLGSRKDVQEILPHLDLLVSASLWEGFPTVLLEAMAGNVPIVATDVSGSRELVQNHRTGLLVPPHNPQSLAQAIFTLLADPAKAQRMAQAAKEYASTYTIQETAKAYSQLYLGL